MWIGDCMEIHAIQLSTARYHHLILLENRDSPLWLSALQFTTVIGTRETTRYTMTWKQRLFQ